MSGYEITVCGYPRSGNTWIARLLGDALDSEVKGFESAIPLATEGRGRPGKYTVRQLHLQPRYGDNDGRGFLMSGWECAVNNWDGHRIVHAVRDPRDVIVSAYYYWEISSVKQTIFAMFRGEEPFKAVGSYQNYVREWLAVDLLPVYQINYEVLHATPVITLMSLLSKMGIPNDDRGNLIKTVERQEIEAKRKQITEESSNDPPRPYGKHIQLKHLRKGIPGEWEHEFTCSDGALCDDLFHDILEELGYIKKGDHEWYQNLREKIAQ